MSMMLAVLLVTSCGEDDGPSQVTITLEPTVGTESLVHGQTYNVNGIDVQFDNFAFYLGDLTFDLSGDRTFRSGDRYQLIRPGTFDYEFEVLYEEGEESASLENITFIVGVDDATNAMTEEDFTMRDESDPLGPQNPTMHWGWQSGYRFMNVDADADLDGDGEFETPLVFHLGGSDFRGDLNITPNIELERGANSIKLNFDVAAFLDGVDFNTEQFTKANINNPELAQKVLANYSSAFVIE